MEKGLIFDIKEFSVHDGPGVRQTVFLKGCPLRCNWCHNPEGWEKRAQLLCRAKECVHCGKCRETCTHEACVACGQCVKGCTARARWICGEALTAQELADRLNKNAAIYQSMGGGVTFSGGEPLMQGAFLSQTLGLLGNMHKTLETCGYASKEMFEQICAQCDLIMMDLKIMDDALHRRHTGVSNRPILSNAAALCAGDTPFVIRIPLIPGVTDTQENIRAAAEFLAGAKKLLYVELLPYNRMAGAKYEWLHRRYEPQFDPEQPVAIRHDIFKQYGIESRER